MKKIFLFLAFTFTLSIAFAQQTPKELKSKIDKVTVFINGAQVTRTVKQNIASGKTELVFKNLPHDADKSSISLRANGAVTVLSVQPQANYLDKDVLKERVKKIDEKRLELEAKIKTERTMLDVYKQEEVMLSQNLQVAGSQSGLKAADLKEVMDFHRTRLIELKQKEGDLEKSLADLNKELAKHRAQIATEIDTQEKPSLEVLILVSAKQTTDVEFELSYYVPAAGWFPNYDVRVEDITQPIKLKYKGNVHQNTGEDWNNIKLTLSNADPNQTGAKPELTPWYLPNTKPVSYNKTSSNMTQVSGKVTEAHTGEPIPFANIMVEGSTVGAVTDFDGNYSLKLPSGAVNLKIASVGYETQTVYINSEKIDIGLISGIQLSEVTIAQYEQPLIQADGFSGELIHMPGARIVSSASNSYLPKADSDKKLRDVFKSEALAINEISYQTNFSFDIKEPYTILSDGKTKVVDVKEMEIPAAYQYTCVPKLDKDAFLTARITDWQDLKLLDGEANLYFEDTYVGKSLISLTTLKDTLDISLGRDKNIIVERKKVKDYSRSQIFGNNTVYNRAWEIGIKNNKKQAINLIIEDQFPVSTVDAVEVKQSEYEGAELDEKTGKLTWKLILQPAEDKKLGFKFSVKASNWVQLYLD